MIPKHVTEEWLAGFFDGEGCIGLQRQGIYGYYARLQLVQKDREILENIQAVFGGHLHHCAGPKTKYKTWRLAWHGKDAVQLAARLLPYSRCKQDQFTTFLEGVQYPPKERATFDQRLREQKREVKAA